MKRLKSQKGESLIETLAAMLVISCGFLILAGGIVTAARINGASKDQNMTFQTETKQEIQDFSVKITYKTVDTPVSKIQAYQTGEKAADGTVKYEDGYIYYEYQKDDTKP